MRLKFRVLPFLRRFSGFAVRAPVPAVRGNMRRVIVLHPGGEIFQEAVFILRDDYFPAGISRQEILRQAYTAAESCLEEYSIPPGGGLVLSPLAVFLSGCACAVLALRIFGLF